MMNELNTRLFARLREENLTVLVVRDEEEIYRSRKPGVGPLLEMYDRFPDGLEGATAVDRVVGGCAARVFVHLRVARVFGVVGSVAARSVLAAHDIPFEVEKGVLEIRNRNGTDTCPFEQLSRHFPDAETLVTAMRDRLARMRAR